MPNIIGKTIKNRYKVIESLGRGGMAEVYQVWDAERAATLAMKVLRQDIAQDPIFLRRFQREAKALASLQHPHIVRYYGLERENLLAFLLMEYVDGYSLQSEILLAEGKPLPEVRILEVLEAVCGALHYAHGKGLVHCDLKPGNIFVEKTGRIVLGDFGITRSMDSSTSTLVGAGSPAYMAPELVQEKDPTAQSDIYALGIILYEMLTGGERPFIGERASITGTTAEKVRWEQVRLEPEPPSKHQRGISNKMDAIVLTCLQKNPNARYASSMDLLEEVRQAVSQDVVGKPHPVQKAPPVARKPKTTPGKTTPRRTMRPKDTGVKTPVWGRWYLWAGIGAAAAALILALVGLPIGDVSEKISHATPLEKTPVPATRTPIPPTPSIAPPSVVKDFLNGVRVTEVDPFDSPYGWNLSAGKISDGSLAITGKNWTGLTRKGEFSGSEGIVINFKFEKDSEFEVYFDYATFTTSRYRRLGLYSIRSYLSPNIWQADDQLRMSELRGNFTVEPDTWYSLLLAKDDLGEFVIAIWDPSKPSNIIRYHKGANSEWAGHTWQLHIGANAGTIEFDDYMKITFNDIW